MPEVTPFPKPEPRGPRQRLGLKRTRLNPVSERRRERWPDERVVREGVFERDGHRCVLARLTTGGAVPPCHGRLTYHHVVKASAGGAYTVENGLTLCAFHNGWVEDEPGLATQLELVRRPHG